MKERLNICGVKPEEIRFDLIGVNSLHGAKLSASSEPYEVRARVAARFYDKAEAIKIGNEVETLYTNGPAGGGGVYKSVKNIVAMDSTLLDRNLVKPVVDYLEV